MKVMALKMGYYGDMRRRPGVIFALKDPKDFSETWMEKVGDDADKKSARRTPRVPEPPAAGTSSPGDSDVI